MSRPRQLAATLRFECVAEEDRPLVLSYLAASLLAMTWLMLVHLVPEPVSVGEVARGAFGMTFHAEVSAMPARYDVRTRYAASFGGSGGYISDRASVVEGIRRFVSGEREAGR